MTDNGSTGDAPALLLLDGSSLTCLRLASHVRPPAAKIGLVDCAWARIERSAAAFDNCVREGRSCYGINTGLGDLIDFRIEADAQDDFQRRLVLSHAVGVKQPLPLEASRALVVLRLNCFAKGASGIRPATVQTIVDLYNAGAVPEIYESGSLGASGDLAPLSQFAAFLLGEGWGYLGSERVRASELYARLGRSPVPLSRKEGLSLINGTSAMVAIGALAATRLATALETFVIGMALLLDAFQLPSDFASEEALKLKPHKGAQWVSTVLSLLLGKRRLPDRNNSTSLQLPYSSRCAPFILGPFVDSLQAAVRTLEIEANSANDNPLFLAENESIYHGGHFHGHPVAVILDQLRVAAVHLSGLVDRQLEFVLDRRRGVCPRPFLAIDPSLGHCGLEGAQYLVTSLHVENKMLANPFSPLTLPTNAGNQDYVSLGMQSALACRAMADNMGHILAVYFITASQCFSLESRSASSRSLEAVLDLINEHLELPYHDSHQFGDLVRCFEERSLLEDVIRRVRQEIPSLPELI